MNEEKIIDSKLYELAIDSRGKIEERREDINKYYTSLFTAIVSVMPFIDKLPIKDAIHISKYCMIHFLLSFLSIIALALCYSWMLTLKRIYHHIEALDKFLMNTEAKYNKQFVIFTKEYLSKVKSPGMVTKNEMMVPYVFIMIFSLVLIYAINSIITK